MRKSQSKGFTLIELLIVVAIIAILAAIAIPNFLAAQTRAKVTRVKGEMRTVTTAIEAYKVDENVYPFDFGTPGGYPYYLNKCLTTPIAYISKGGSSGERYGGLGIMLDPFAPPGTILDHISLRYRFRNFENNWCAYFGWPQLATDAYKPGIQKGLRVLGAWRLSSRGPDRATTIPTTAGEGFAFNDGLIIGNCLNNFSRINKVGQSIQAVFSLLWEDCFFYLTKYSYLW
ncbi:MAG: prepilin-type N-terminal cleavage/methylation domain-containing protein [bacterium]|nr:prepilin-type N-terminal cleavage/methylation domain-containing protein [bacterium]